MILSSPRRRGALLIAWLLRLSTAAALAIDAYVHADLVARYDPNEAASGISQGDLFEVEAAAASFAALGVILTAWRVTWALAVLVAASALGGLLLYRYGNPGAIGPLPDMYEPIWFPEKTLAAVAEAVAVITAALGLVQAWLPRRADKATVRPHAKV